MGNPPWISLRYMEPAYQDFLKRQITDEYRLLAKRGELITHLEIATLFLVRAADLFLKTKGIIAFVLPRGLFSSDQHDGLRRHTFKFSEDRVSNLFWRELWDCESVQPLFKVPACVIFGDKLEPGKVNHPLKPDSPIKGEVLSGILDRKNASLSEVEKNLTVTDVQFFLNIHGKRSYWAVGKETRTQGVSFYKKEFAQGATIVPRSFWFVRVKASPLGFDPNRPPIETDPRAIKEAKKPYRDVKFEGNVESGFIYATLLSTDLLPFGHFGYRLVLLPIKREGNQYKIVDTNEALKYGFLSLAQWLEKSESEWIKRRGAKAERMTIYERLDRVHGLTNQNPQAKYRVIYNTSGTFLTAAIVVNKPIDFEIKGQHLAGNGFIVDHKTYRYESSNKHEAYYLGAVLNAPVIDELIKPMQSRGLFGPRDIHKKVLELPIPRFDSTNSIHIQLAELGNKCEKKVENWLRSGGAGKIKSIGKLRSMVRAILKDDLKQIDILVKKIL